MARLIGEPRSVDVAWGPDGLRSLAPRCDVLVVVDVLRFTTAVEVAVSRGAAVYPYRWHDGTETQFAAGLGAELAVPGLEVDRDHPWSLSPTGLSGIPPGTELVLPSPNGAALAFDARESGVAAVVAGCLRNAPAVGAWVRGRGGRLGVLAAGERWRSATGPLRPAVEDWLGAGAVVAAADPAGAVSTPDASAAAASFRSGRERLGWMLAEAPSGRELVERGWDGDVTMAADHGVSDTVPVLVDGRFVDARSLDSRPLDARGPTSRMGE